jgi:hypothetical protein
MYPVRNQSICRRNHFEVSPHQFFPVRLLDSNRWTGELPVLFKSVLAREVHVGAFQRRSMAAALVFLISRSCGARDNARLTVFLLQFTRRDAEKIRIELERITPRVLVVEYTVPASGTDGQPSTILLMSTSCLVRQTQRPPILDRSDSCEYVIMLDHTCILTILNYS